jgi:hypothetical protein
VSSIAVASLERFVFRYKTIGNAHVSPMTELYMKHAKTIRASSSTYKVGSLRTDLKALIDKNVPDDLFRANLRETRYRPRAGNGHIRYMLVAIEDHIDWLKGAAAGAPKCKDKSVVFDFSNTTLEHVYPRSAKATDKITALEVVKDTLGNLTTSALTPMRPSATSPTPRSVRRCRPRSSARTAASSPTRPGRPRW